MSDLQCRRFRDKYPPVCSLRAAHAPIRVYPGRLQCHTDVYTLSGQVRLCSVACLFHTAVPTWRHIRKELTSLLSSRVRIEGCASATLSRFRLRRIDKAQMSNHALGMCEGLHPMGPCLLVVLILWKTTGPTSRRSTEGHRSVFVPWRSCCCPLVIGGIDTANRPR